MGKVLDGGAASPLSAKKLINFEETARKTEEFYREILSSFFDTAY
jgi:hypothetical protein